MTSIGLLWGDSAAYARPEQVHSPNIKLTGTYAAGGGVDA